MTEPTPPTEPTPDPEPTSADSPASVDPTLAGKEKSGAGRRNLWIGIGAVVVIAAVVLGVVFTRTGGQPAQPASSPAGSEAAAVLDDATLTVGLTLEPTNLDIRTTSGAALDQVLIDNIYQPLVRRSADGTLTPSLASAWTTSDDALTYTFTIVQGATFSNGTPITAATAAASINSVIDQKYSGSEFLGSVDSVTAPSDTELVITLTQPYPDLVWALSGRAGLVLDTTSDNDLATTAIGSGPFTLKEWKQGDSITLARNDSYWGAKPKLAEVVFRYITDVNAAANALKSGDLDVLAPIDANLSKQVSTEDFNVVKGGSSDKFVLAFNNGAKPLNDLKVRQAIRYAIDHPAIVEARGGVDGLLGGPIPDVDPGYEDLTGLYPHDVDKAKALLAEAGYADGLTLTLTIPSFYGDTFPNLLTSQLAEAGITLKTDSVPFATWLEDVYTKKDYQLSIVDHAESHDFGSWANPDYYFNYDNAEVQKLYADSQVATSEDESNSLLAQAARLVSEDAAADWLVNFRTVTAIRHGVSGFPTDQINSRLDVSGVTVAA